MSSKNTENDELVVFSPDTINVSDKSSDSACTPWRILVVDDDLDIHEVTRFTLEGKVCNGRGLIIQSAYSGAQALQLVAKSGNQLPDLVLIDVVMTTPTDGIDTAHNIRLILKQHKTPYIIVRTGQAGYQDIDAIRKDKTIDCVLLKAEVTSRRLRNAVFRGLIDSSQRAIGRSR